MTPPLPIIKLSSLSLSIYTLYVNNSAWKSSKPRFFVDALCRFPTPTFCVSSPRELLSTTTPTPTTAGHPWIGVLGPENSDAHALCSSSTTLYTTVPKVCCPNLLLNSSRRAVSKFFQNSLLRRRRWTQYCDTIVTKIPRLSPALLIVHRDRVAWPARSTCWSSFLLCCC